MGWTQQARARDGGGSTKLRFEEAYLKHSKKEIRHPARAASTGAYSDGIVLEGWLYVSGQGPLDLRTGEVAAGTIEEETRLTMSHIEKILEAAGCRFDDVVKCTCHLADIRDFDGFNRAYAEFFRGVRPARTTVQSVLGGGIKVEIDAIARVPSAPPTI